MNSVSSLAGNLEALAEIAAETQLLNPAEARVVERGLLAGGEVSVIPAAAFSSDEDLPRSLFFSFSSGRMRGDELEGNGCVKGEIVISTTAIIGPQVTYPDDAIFLTTCVQAPGTQIISTRVYYHF